jgi:ribokinase
MKIAVVGSINMDMIVTAERIPSKGETLIGNSINYISGGKGANQAVAMSRLGAEVTMFGCVGDDSSGRQLIEKLKNEGIETRFIGVVEGTSTGTASITIAENDNTIIVVAGANEWVDRSYLRVIDNELKVCDMVVLQHEIPLETVKETVDFCYENKIPVILNPAPALPLSMEIIEKVTYVTPNEHEARIIFGEDISREELLRKYPEKLIITLGSQGVITCLKSGEILQVPARPANVVDTTGAGDTLNGAFAVRIAGGDNIENALVYANTAAGISTERFGAQGGMPASEEVTKKLQRDIW